MSASQGARKRLPVKPSEENLRKQAKRRAKLDSVDLARAQHSIAKEYGFDNWAKLLQHVEALRDTSGAWHSDPNDNLPKSANAGDVAKVRAFLASGNFSQHELDLALGRVVCGMGEYSDADRWVLADLLIDHGADPDGQYGGGFGRIIFGACEGTDLLGLRYLIERGADVTDALPRLLGTYERGKNDARHKAIDLLLSRGATVPAEVTPAMLAIHRGDVAQLADLIAADPELPRRRFRDMPYGNMRLRGATLLHQAVEFGEIDCIDALLDRWSDANPTADIVDGLGGQSPVFHAIATNQGRNLYTLEHLVKRLSYGIESHRIRGTFKVYDVVFDKPMNPNEYAEAVSGEDTPAWRRATPRDLELIRSVTWPGIKRKTEEEKSPVDRLQEACRRGDFDAVKRLVESGDVPANKLQLGIEGCALSKREDMARYLIDHGADINADYIDNYGPVLLGFCEGLNDEGVEFVLKLGARADWARRPTSKYPEHSTPLLMTCQTYVRGRNAAKHRILDLLIAAGAKPEDEVLMAVHRGDVKRLAELIDADPTIVHRERQWSAMFNFADEPRLARGTLLHVAIDQNEIGCADLILSRYRSWNDTDINSKAEMLDDLGGHSPLFLAASSWMGVGYPTLQWIIERVGQYIDTGVVGTMRKDGKPVEQTVMEYAGERERKLIAPYDRITQIRRAIEANDVPTFVRMLDEHPDLATPRLWPAVIHKAKSVEMTRILLDRGVDPSACPAPRKPLHLATYYHLADIVELLVERGADVTFLNPLDETPLCLIGEYEPHMNKSDDARRCRAALLNAGAKHRFHTAIRAGELELVRQMLDAEPELVNMTKPWSGLFTAARTGQLEVARLLLNRGAKVDGPNDKGNTPLWFACQSSATAEDRIAVAKLLIDAGADVNRRCEEGSTPLHYAAWRGPKAMVTLLLDHGARHWIADDKEKTPADYARDSRVNDADKDAILEVLTGFHTDDIPFRDAIAAIDAGDIARLKQLLAEHPRLVTDRLKSDSSLTRGYFANPALLWFAAENPIRNRKLPPNIVEVAETIIDAGAKLDDIKYTCALVASGLVPQVMKLQIPLIEMLVRRGASPDDALGSAIGEHQLEAAEAALRLGAKHTLESAAAMGEGDILRRLLKENPTEKQKLQALMFAAKYGRIGSVDTLLDAGVDVNARLPRVFEPTALHEAANAGHRRLVERMLQRGADPTIRDTQFDGTAAGWAWHGGHKELSQYINEIAPLVRAVGAMRLGDVEELTRLLAEHPDVTHARLNGRTLLHILCDWPANMPRSSDSARALVAAGIDVNVPLHQDTDHVAREWAHNATPLHWAASSNDAAELCQTLIDLGADIEATTADDGTTPLTNAMHFNIKGAADVLLRAGARTSVIIAAGLGDLALVKSYFNPDGSLKPGAGDPPFKHTDTRKILSQAINFAASHGHEDVIRYLAERGAPLSDVDTFVNYFCTPLHRAVLRNSVSTVKLLLELGADASVQDPAFNATPLGWARHNGKHEVAAVLEEAEKGK